ncbi:3-phenylpropionate/cinnamic acid dioxygenase subunit alpha [Posidoniimonas corsicana]|uniref:3-phenylpropionate/cinnamic acid dioxygenase subunit alpha n=1 Tax=Posidoniimonas corsicana TaxID=1938618 RepID=A0A5C5UUM4_9BACT|nr:SRPBCC family protein [Posidoniimonas corsicana]TWT29192.1 3-phenylpropionate/cinnamic acid dioxygenase subunit alpha [Posidoniimonas corsicana]
MDVRFAPDIPIESAPTPPSSWYTEPVVLAAEKRRVFQTAWIAVGRADQLAGPGSYFTGNLVGNPYIVLRDDDGGLRAFHNVCRHHAAVVAQECGRASELVCPYHGWTYRLDGRLKRAPHMGRMEGVNVGDLGLPPISVEQWGPFVLIDLDGPQGGPGNPRDLAADVGPLNPPLDELGFQHMQWVERRTYTINCNWKVFVENSLDGGYHVAYAHEQLAGSLEFDGYATSIFDRGSVQVCGASGEDDRLGKKVTYAWLYPNFFINRYGRMMDTNLVLPTGVDTCEVVFDFYVDYDDAEEWEAKRTIRKSISQSHVIQQEDIEICESTQQGLRSMSFHSGRYSSLLEKSVHAFHAILWDEIKDDLTQ